MFVEEMKVTATRAVKERLSDRPSDARPAKDEGAHVSVDSLR
jgi:hypothetical protein